MKEKKMWKKVFYTCKWKHFSFSTWFSDETPHHLSALLSLRSHLVQKVSLSKFNIVMWVCIFLGSNIESILLSNMRRQRRWKWEKGENERISWNRKRVSQGNKNYWTTYFLLIRFDSICSQRKLLLGYFIFS